MTPLKVAEAIGIGHEWVARYAAEHPQFVAAHLMGSVTRLPPEEQFPGDSDLDMMLVVDGLTETSIPIDEFYRGVAIEAGTRDIADYDSADKVLANLEVADYIAAGAIISDPTGLLASIQRTVAREFGLRRWVIARCDDEKSRFHAALRASEQAASPFESAARMIFVTVSLAGLIAVAQLIPPTQRKCLPMLREHLSALGRPELYGEVLAGSGARDLTRSRVQYFADRWAMAFDRAIEVKRTPSPFDFKLRAHLRPYLIDWTQSMIDRGEYREVVPWIVGGIAMSTVSLLNDAPANEKPRYLALVDELVNELGFATTAGRQERFAKMAEVGSALVDLADEIALSRPDVSATH